MKEKTMSESIFPKIDIAIRGSTTRMQTTLRKEHEGVYYLWRFARNWDHTTERDQERLQYLFLVEVYMAILVGKIDPSLVDIYGKLLFEKDSNTQTELQRLFTINLKPKDNE